MAARRGDFNERAVCGHLPYLTGDLSVASDALKGRFIQIK